MQTDLRQADLPNYRRPPLVEVALAVQFAPPKSVGVGHLGAFWAAVKDQFPLAKSTQPISTPADDFAAEAQWVPPSLRFALVDEPDARLQMFSEDDQWVWQVQSDRLVVNWRKRADEYPRYGATLTRLREAWHAWCEFLSSEGIGVPEPHLWEVTYVNHVPSGETALWNETSDWPSVFPGLWSPEFSAAPGLTLKGLRGQWVWDHADPRARLYVEAKPSVRKELPVMILTLTARGPVSQGDGKRQSMTKQEWTPEQSLAVIERGLDLGHRMIVCSFDALGSSSAKTFWERHEPR